MLFFKREVYWSVFLLICDIHGGYIPWKQASIVKNNTK